MRNLLLLTLAVIIAAFACLFFESSEDYKAWNGGKCEICNGEYRFANGFESVGNTHYFYTCDNCGHTIKTHELMK